MSIGHQERQFLDALAAAAPEERGPLDAVTLREGYRALARMLPAGPDVATRDAAVPGPAGEVAVRIYTPAGEGPHGVLVYLHGGGWTIGGLDTHDHPCRTLCHDAGLVVVSVDYRLAPEHPFPAAIDDAWAALRWVADHAGDLGADPSRLAIGGDSGGGNLAAVLALMARDAGGPDLRFQLLVYPSVDLRPGSEERYPSLVENAEGYFLTSETMRFFRECYLSHRDDTTEWRASPLVAEDHHGLPPALVLTAELDPLRDEGRAYAEVLEAAGVAVTHTLYEGTIHGMFQLAPLLDAGAAALAESSAALRDAVGGRR